MAMCGGQRACGRVFVWVAGHGLVVALPAANAPPRGTCPIVAAPAPNQLRPSAAEHRHAPVSEISHVEAIALLGYEIWSDGPCTVRGISPHLAHMPAVCLAEYLYAVVAFVAHIHMLLIHRNSTRILHLSRSASLSATDHANKRAFFRHHLHAVVV